MSVLKSSAISIASHRIEARWIIDNPSVYDGRARRVAQAYLDLTHVEKRVIFLPCQNAYGVCDQTPECKIECATRKAALSVGP